MKKLSVLGMLILVAMFSFTAKADIITLDGANEIANAFFANSATSQKKQMKSITQLEYAWDSNSLKSQGSSMMKSVDEDPTFYVFNNPDGEGFVIVSGDDNARSVIGYSYEGNIPAADEIPAPMQDYLLGIDEEIKWARTNLTSSNKNLKATLNETGGTQEQYLETPSWGQNAPFNNLCPIINGSDGKGGCVDYHAKTGCVPTAFASVMRYHKWPVQGIGTILGSWTYDLCAGTKQDIRTETIDHAATTYDWDNMPLTYSDSWTEAQKTQVATLMRNVGYAFGVEYLQGATNYNEGKTIPTLVTSRFGYTYETVLWGQSGVSDGAITDTDEWISKLKESLDNYCPIPYGAKNWGTGDSRHMFVVDGYTSNNYFHFNFGWTGSGNGWFLITAVTPLTGDDYSWKTESKHRAYINFRPDTNVTVSVAVDGTGSAYIGQEDVTSTTVNFGDPITLTATGDNFVGWVVDGTIVSDDEEYTITASATKTYTAKFAQSYPLQVQATLDLDVEDTNNSVDQSADNVYIGAQVILTATPARGYAFDGWYFLGTETFEYKSNSLTYTATIEDSPWHSALGYIPVFAKFSSLSSVTITTASSDNAMGTATWSFNGVEGNATTIVYPGEEITLTATPKSGYMFAGWTTDGTNVVSTSLEFTTTVPEQSNVTYTAKFTLAGADYYVNKETGTFGGITYNSRNSIWTYNTNTSSNPVALEIKTTNASGAEVGAMTNAGSSSSSLKYYVYGGDSNNNITTPVTYTLSVPEGFIITGYEMTYSVSKTGNITVSNADGDVTPAANPTTLTAKNLTESSTSFTLTGTANSYYITVSSFKVSVLSTGGEGPVTPTTQYTVTVNSNPGTAGTVSINGYDGNTATVVDGYELSFLATPVTGYEFVNWTDGSGNVVATNAEFYKAITSNVTYTANFAKPKYTASVAVNGTGGTATVAVGTGAASSSVEVEAGTNVTFYATANDGYKFVNWTNGTNEYAENPFDVPINANLQLTANFVADEPSTPTSYPTMTVSGYDTGNMNRYLAKVTASTATQNVTVFEVTSESADDFTNPTTTALIDKTATPIKVTKGERALSMTFITWLNNVSGKASQMNWVQQAVYIDWNKDGNFTDSEIYEKSSDALGGTLDGGAGDPISTSFKETSGYTRMITIPANQEVGTYRMRVVYHEPAARGTNNWHKTLFGTGNGAISKGRAYDFSLEIVEGGSTPIEPSDPKTLSAISVFSKGENSSTHYRIPALVELENGTLVAIADKRGSAINDLPNTISIVAKTSTNKGETWSDMVTVAQGNATEGTSFGDAAAVYDEVEKKIVAVFVGYKNYGSGGGVSLWSSSSSKLMRLYQSESIDGKTWTTPKDITEQVYSGVYQSDKLGETRFGLFAGSGSAVQLKQGINKGRLMFVVAARQNSTESGAMSNFAVYSDDHGQTWQVSNNAASSYGDEAKVVELSNGDLLMSIKNRNKVSRLMAKSTNQGANWSSFTPTTNVLDPACNGDVVSTTYGGKYYLLHSIPANSTTRRDVSIYISEDDGTNWTLAKQVFNSYSAYSSLEVLNDGTVGIIVEEGKWDSGISGEDVFNLKYYSYTMDQLLPETPEEPETPVEDKALELDGTRYMSIPNDAAFSIAGGGSYTITFKVKIPQYKSGANMRFVSNRAYEGTANSGTTGFDIYGGNSSSQAVSVNLSYDGKPWSNSFAWNTGLTENNWAHISWVLDGTSTYLYVDGVKKETKTGMSTLGMPSKANILVGAGYTNTDGSAVQPSFFTTGSIDNVRFYNKALSQSEVQADMTSTVNSSTANLVAAYDFNNIQGLSVEDISGNGHTGTLVGFPEPDVQYTASVKAGSNGTANVNDSTSVTVNSGTEVTYTATANDGYRFTGWSNGTTTVSTDNPYSFNVTSDIELTANFQEVGMSVVQLDRTNWSVTASTQEPAEAQWGGGGETRHAIDNSETTFWHSQWDASKPTVPHWIQFNLGGLYEISAINYVSRSSVTNQNNGQIKDYRLYISSSDISANINSTTYVPNGLEPVKDDVFTYGTTNHHNVTLDAPVIGQYIYLLVDDSYNVDASGIKFANCAEFYASGKPAYTVSATASPNNGGTASVSANVIGAGESVTFTATPSTGYNFAGWYNGENKVSEDTEYTATNIKSTLSLTAKFEKQTFEVSVTAGAGGSVSSITNPVEYGTLLELTATPEEGYVFAGWSNGTTTVSTDNPYTVTVTENISLTANFVAIPTYTVTVTTNGNGSVEKSAGSVLAGNTVTLTATPATGYRFVDWSDGSKANPRTITVTEDVYLTANFVEVSQDAPLLTFACLSDLHAQQDFISDANNIRLRESVTKTLKAIKEQQEKVDLIVLGGDYTSNTYIPQTSWQVTKDSLIEATRNVFPEGAKTPVIYVNGNHEYEVAYPNIANSDGTPKQYNAGEYYGTPMKTDIGELREGDYFYETASNGTGDSVSLLAAYHYVVNGFDFVVLNTGKNFFASASDYTYSEESVTWVSNKLAQICTTDKNKTIFFLVHIPFYDSNSISDVEKAMNTGSSSPAVETLKTTLAQYPNLVMLYGHDHGKDMAYIRENTEQRVTEYATDGNRYTSYCIQNYNTNKYLGYNSFNLTTTSEACDVAITPSVVTEGAFVFYLTTTIKNQRNYINYINCGSSGRFSGNNGHTTENQQIKLFEVENPDETTITATQATSIVPGKTYMLVGVKEGNYYALTNEMYQNNTTNQRMVGAAVTIADGTITYTRGTASVLWTIKEKSPAAEKSFISSFMGSMRYYNNSFEDGQINPRRIIQALMVYVYSDRVELKMKNYGEGNVTSNGITVNQDLTPYVSYRTVTHSDEQKTATPVIISTGGDVAPNTVVTVTVDAPEWHNLYYTTDGTEPTEESTPVDGREFTFTPSTTGKVTVKVAAQEGIRLISASDSVTYTVVDTHGITVSTNGEGGTAQFSIDGDNVILTASPKEGYDFVNWTLNDNVVAETAEATIKYEEDAQYVANFAKQTFTVTVTATEGGSVNTITDPVEYGTTLTLTATPNDGYQFVNWTNANGEEVSTDNPYEVTVEGALTLRANFEEELSQITPVSASTNFGVYQTYVIDNIKDNSLSTKFWSNANQEIGKYVMLDLGSYYNVSDIELYFDSGDQPAAATVETSKDNSSWSPVSSFVKNDIKLIEQNIGLYSCNASKAMARYVRMRITTPTSGSWFQMHEFKVYGKWAGRKVAIATNNRDLGYAGYVSPEPEGATALDITTSEPVTVMAYLQPDANSRFVNWTINGEEVGTEPTYTYTERNEATIVANFEEIPEIYTVSVSSNNRAMGSATMSATTPTVEERTSVTFTATAYEGYEFVNWTNANGEEVSTDATYTITITANTALKAVFQEIAGLTGRWYRIKNTNDNVYLNVANTDCHPTGTVGGVNCVALDKSSDKQLFMLEASGTNYTIKTKGGNYIYCQEWNVDALPLGYQFSYSKNNQTINRTVVASPLTFVDNGDGTYTIKNGSNYFKAENVSGTIYPFCDAPESSKATWVLEPVKISEVNVKKASNNATIKVTTDQAATIKVGGSTKATNATSATVTIGATDGNVGENIKVESIDGYITSVECVADVELAQIPVTVTEITLRNTTADDAIIDSPALSKITVVSDAENNVAKVSTTSNLSQGVQVVVEKEIKTPVTENGSTPTYFNFLSMPFAFNTSSIKYWDGDTLKPADPEEEVRILLYDSQKRANGVSATWRTLGEKEYVDIAANQGFVIVGSKSIGQNQGNKMKLQFTSATEAYDGSVNTVTANSYRKESGSTADADKDWNFNGVPYLTNGVMNGYTLYFHNGYGYEAVPTDYALESEKVIAAYQGVMYQANIESGSREIYITPSSASRITKAADDVFARAYISVDDAAPAKIILSDESSENFVVNEDAWYMAPTANAEAAAYFNVQGADALVSVQPAASELPMTVYTGAGTQHRIALTTTDGNYDVYLKDAVTDEVVCLNDEDYTFTATAKTTIANRFTVSMIELTGIIEAAREEGTIKAVVVGDVIKLYGTEEGDQVTLYSTNGMVITNAVAEDGVTSIATSAEGVIIIKVAEETVKVVK